jgi:hypothetical protein
VQRADGEDLGDVDQPLGQRSGDEHPRDEAQREDDGLHDGLRRISVVHDGRQGEPEAAERDGADAAGGSTSGDGQRAAADTRG